MAIPLSLHIDTTPTGALILTLDGALADPDSVDQMFRLVGGYPGDVIFDLRGLTAVDATIAQPLAAELAKCASAGRHTAVVQPAPHLWERLEPAGLRDLCRPCACLRDAAGVATGH